PSIVERDTWAEVAPSCSTRRPRQLRLRRLNAPQTALLRRSPGSSTLDVLQGELAVPVDPLQFGLTVGQRFSGDTDTAQWRGYGGGHDPKAATDAVADGPAPALGSRR